MNIFEYAAGVAVVVSSDIKSNLELNETKLVIVYFKADDFDDFREKISNLILDTNLRQSLIENSKNNIDKYSVNERIKLLINFCVRSSTG